MFQNSVTIVNTRPEHAETLSSTMRTVYAGDTNAPCDDTATPDHIYSQIRRFSEGQFVALLNGEVVGFATTMRTHDSPQAAPLPWIHAIGDLHLRNHTPQGEWLYGVDFGVHPEYRKHGIGTKLYQARFNLVRRLNLRGFYAGGMLMGYARYQLQMSISEYADKVMRGELCDPTVTMQINRGFKPRRLIENYIPGTPPHNAAMLIEWANTQYDQPPLQAALS